MQHERDVAGLDLAVGLAPEAVEFRPSRAVAEALARFGRTEDVRFSPDNRLLAIAGYHREACLFLRIEIGQGPRGPLVAANDVREVEAMLERRPELALDPFAFHAEGILSMPANRRHRGMIDLLLRHGARVPPMTKWGAEYYFKHDDIAAMFPDAGYELHDICIRSGERTMVVTIYDTCGDADCDGCCTENKGDADALIDLESFTNARWGLPDGDIEWADLGPTSSDGCEG